MILHMKKIILIPIIFLSGCINLTFDPIEFDRYLIIAEDATILTPLCGTDEFIPKLNRLKRDVDHQVSYSGYRSNGRPHIAAAANNLKEIVDGLYDSYQSDVVPSIEYCKQKTVNISTGALLLVKELGRL